MTEALLNTAPPAITSEAEGDTSRNNTEACGVLHMLEIAPFTPWYRLNKKHKKALKTKLRAFNNFAEKIRQDKVVACYQPTKLPLPLNPSTRVFFGYQVTRIAFCVDASQSLTSTFGVSGSLRSTNCCPIDALPEMAKMFFTSLVEPVQASSLNTPSVWRPELAVSVLAVFPLGDSVETDLLVRDYRVHNIESAQTLARNIEEWVKCEVEEGISKRSSRRHGPNSWSVPLYSSSLRSILEAGDYALSVLSSNARPLIVVATDGRAVTCDGISDVFVHTDRVDIPVIVLDLSDPDTHTPFSMEDEQIPHRLPSGENEPNFLTYDPGGPSGFPLHLSDDTEALFDICEATGGVFLDRDLLSKVSKNTLEQGPNTKALLTADHYYSVRKRFTKMNGLQWLTLFNLSPLSPAFQSPWGIGKLIPPQYLRKYKSTSTTDAAIENEPRGDSSRNFERHESFKSPKQGTDLFRFSISPSLNEGSVSMLQGNVYNRVTFSTYVVSPIRIKGLLLMRIREGYRTKQYGQSTQDPDKVTIQLTLKLDHDTVLHYELSYRALPGQNNNVGSAHVKIELSGEPGFVQTVKNNFLRQIPDVRPSTMAQRRSTKLCRVLRWIRQEDCLQSYLCPPLEWSDQLSSPEKPFVRRLGNMQPLQRFRHFHVTEFDVICTGMMPYAHDDNAFLIEFMDTDNGEQELVDELGAWSTQVIRFKDRYVKEITSSDGLPAYCVVGLRKSSVASRLFTISVETFGIFDPTDRIHLVSSLKAAIGNLKDVDVLVKQMGPFLFGTNSNFSNIRKKIDIQYHHESWDLLDDAELLPLLSKRRTEIGNFRLLQSTDQHAIFAKVVPEVLIGAPGDLVQYQIAIMKEKIVIDLHMESESGMFFPFRAERDKLKSTFARMVHILRRRDQECGRALRSRTNLLQVLRSKDGEEPILEAHIESVKRLLQYTSKVERRIRFFTSSAGVANRFLFGLTEDLLLSDTFDVMKSSRLNIDSSQLVKEQGHGDWFIIRFDRHTISLVHLSLENTNLDVAPEAAGGDDSSNSPPVYPYRDLTFFTFGLSDLYSKRDDGVDDDSVDTHISEYLCVSEFCGRFDQLQKENFAAAAYLALRSTEKPAVDYFSNDDLSEVLSICSFVEAASVVIPPVSLLGETEQQRLGKVMQTMLLPVPGDDGCYYYSGNETENQMLRHSEGMDSDGSSGGESIGSLDRDSVLGNEHAGVEHHRQPSSVDDDALDLSLDGEDHLEEPFSGSYQTQVPLFVRIELDGQPATLSDLNQVERSSKLTVRVSVFSHDPSNTEESTQRRIPWSHQLFSIEMESLLKSYVAEQTVERLRYIGPGISREDLRVVKSNLKRVRSLVSFSIEVFFYVSKIDLMVPSSTPAGGEAEVEEGFHSLNDELVNNGSYTLQPVGVGSYVVMSVSPVSGAVPFWAFVKINRVDGTITAQIYHPGGEEEGSHVGTKIHNIVCWCIHRVNQRLLLKQ